MKTTLSLIAFTAFLGLSSYAADLPKIGSAAPSFPASDTKGQPRSLSDFKGKYVGLEGLKPEAQIEKQH